MKPVCVRCELDMTKEESGVNLVEMASFGPYKIWSSDLWRCRECKNEKVSGFGQKPMIEHFQVGFKDLLEKISVDPHEKVVRSYERPKIKEAR